MIVCERGFVTEDPDRLGYSLREIDYYAYIPTGRPENAGVQTHRLSLRKNLKTGNFELYRHYADYMNIDDRVIFATENLQDALDFGCAEWNKYWGDKDYQKEPDIACKHEYPVKEDMCDFWTKHIKDMIE
jgi:hypothetical protein